MTDALFDVEGMATPAPQSPRRRRKGDVPTTPDGDTSADILSGWIGFLQENTGVPVPNTICSRMGRQIKSLIQTGYASNQIKRGMVVWTGNWLRNPLTTPEQLANIVWKVTMDTSPKGQQFQKQYEEAMARIRGHTNAAYAGPSNAKQGQRDASNAEAKSSWREEYAARKRMEEDL